MAAKVTIPALLQMRRGGQASSGREAPKPLLLGTLRPIYAF
jgi:hypothetical protein